MTEMTVLLSICLVMSCLCQLASSEVGFSHSYASSMNSFIHSNNIQTSHELQMMASLIVTRKNIENFLQNISLSQSTACVDKLHLIIKNKNESWAFKFFDSYAKPPSGVTLGAFNWFGSYGLCTYLNKSYESPIKTHYCTTYLSHRSMKTTLNVGICLPKVCTDEDLMKITPLYIDFLENMTGFNLSVINVSDRSYCHTKNQLTTGAYVMISIITAITVLILIGTAIDYYYYCKPRVQFQLPPALQFSGNDDNVEEPIIVEESDRVSPNKYLDDPYDRKYYERLQSRSSTGVKLFLAFSLKRNISKLFDTACSNKSLECIHGIRFLSMCWIILAHVYGFTKNFSNNYKEFENQEFAKHSFDIVVAGTFAVDSFFLISGILIAYLFHSTIRQNPEKRTSIKFWIHFYFHRIWRLTPPYMLFLGTYVTLVPYLSEGPIWPKFQGSADPICDKDWWKNLLYINNLFGRVNETCMPHSWYLANEMQFFVISPLFLIVMHNKWLAGVLINLVVTALSLIVIFFVSYENEFSIMYKASDASIYIRPWTRISPYMIGLIFGYVLYKQKCKKEFSRIVNFLFWMCALVLSSIFIFAFHNELTNHQPLLNPDESAVINSFCRLAWALSLGWIIYSCCNKYGGVINRILSWKAFVPLSRLSYCAYLVHPIVMYVCLYSLNQPFILNGLAIAQIYVSFLVLSYGVAFIVHMFYEVPMMELEKALI